MKYFKDNKDDVITGPDDPRLAVTNYKTEKQDNQILSQKTHIEKKKSSKKHKRSKRKRDKKHHHGKHPSNKNEMEIK